jgi:hypothetical protein
MASGNVVGGLLGSDVTSIGNSNGFDNFFVGPSGNSTMSGMLNTGMGYSALASDTSGSGNAAFGLQALNLDTTGYYNTAVGNEALLGNTTGFYNTAEGAFALGSNTNGCYNTAIGAFALDDNKSGSFNAALGYEALNYNTTGSNNTAVGFYAGLSVTTGGNNVLLGQGAGDSITAGSGNIAIGAGAGIAISTGNNNIDIGNAGFNNESGVIRIGTTQTKAVFNGIYNNPISTASSVVCVNSSGLIGTVAGGGATLTGDLALDPSAYHSISMTGGNSLGFLYGQYNAFGNLDGIHLGYNFYYDTGGTPHIPNAGGGTSRITVGYSDIAMYVAPVNTAPTANYRMMDISTAGVCISGTLSQCSDRNVKQDFSPISPLEILDRVLQLPVSEWSYKSDAATRHIGPMAQDFYSAFNVGQNEKYITTVDEGGVALAAIQGLNQKLEQKNVELQALEQRLEKLEQFLEHRDGGKK